MSRSRGGAALSGLLAVVLFTVLPGCGPSGPQKYPVTGQVNFKNQPLAQGTIVFAPEDESKGEYASYEITEGKYASPPNDGLLPGKYKVMITASEGGPAEPKPDDPPGVSTLQKELIPEQFNTNSTLVRTVEARDPNQFDFDIK